MHDDEGLTNTYGNFVADAATESVPTPRCELPLYNCHKQVRALKIKEIKQAPADHERMNPGGDWHLIPVDESYGPIVVGHDEYYSRFQPQVGGYYVVYKDGYRSYSPAAAFEEGYTLA